LRITALTKKELMQIIDPMPDDAFIQITYISRSEELNFYQVGGPISYIKLDLPNKEFEYDGQITLVLDEKYLADE